MNSKYLESNGSILQESFGPSAWWIYKTTRWVFGQLSSTNLPMFALLKSCCVVALDSPAKGINWKKTFDGSSRNLVPSPKRQAMHQTTTIPPTNKSTASRQQTSWQQP